MMYGVIHSVSLTPYAVGEGSATFDRHLTTLVTPAAQVKWLCVV